MCDRYAYSGQAYTLAKETAITVEWVCQADAGLPGPDVVFFLHLPPDDAQTRKQFGGERFENIAFQKKVSQNFDGLYNRDQTSDPNGPKWFKVDARKSVIEVHEIVKAVAVNVIKAVRYSKLGRV